VTIQLPEIWNTDQLTRYLIWYKSLRQLKQRIEHTALKYWESSLTYRVKEWTGDQGRIARTFGLGYFTVPHFQRPLTRPMCTNHKV